MQRAAEVVVRAQEAARIALHQEETATDTKSKQTLRVEALRSNEYMIIVTEKAKRKGEEAGLSEATVNKRIQFEAENLLPHEAKDYKRLEVRCIGRALVAPPTLPPMIGALSSPPPPSLQLGA